MSTDPLFVPALTPDLASEPALAAAPEPVAAVVPADVVPTAVVSDTAGRIGRFSHAELTAMQGKRGRKPPEFYQLFPRADGVAPSASATVKKPRAPRARTLPAVSSAIIGDHTIDDLLAMIGTTGRKPVAYDILQQAAQVFADAGEVELPVAAVDPLLAAYAAAPKGVREAITALLAATAKRAPRD